jgi:hydroxyethylthiazole kinase-like uncharacterized protein yjeF
MVPVIWAWRTKYVQIENRCAMTELLTAAQMRAIEAAAIALGEVSGLELMERAGRGVVEAVFAEWPELAAGSFRAVVLCGAGGNGGDGFVVARLLKEWGWEVEVFLYGTPEAMPADARVNYERWGGMGDVRTVARNPGKCDLVVDALFGIGLTRPIDDPALQELLWFVDDARDAWDGRAPTHSHAPRTVAVDLPSGLDSDTGRVIGGTSAIGRRAAQAMLTVTFGAPKLGHHLADGPDLCGQLRVVPIGVEDRRSARKDASASLVEVKSQAAHLGKWHGHKFSHGHALILSGPSGHGGAARMTARGALRIGAGLVTLGCPAEALAENAARLDAVMLTVVEDGAALEAVLGDARINAVCVGPGLGLGEREAEVVRVVLAVSRGAHGGVEPHPTRRVVLDADAMTLIARDPALFGMLHEGCVLTPHGGEFARLFPDIAAKLEAPATKGPAYSKVDATREAAARAGCVVLFKGADTVIASPDGTCAINSAAYDRAAPWLATAGSGDVLAGFITGLLARGFGPQQAAETAAWLHVECARSFGPGLIAEDLPDELPRVFRALGL